MKIVLVWLIGDSQLSVRVNGCAGGGFVMDWRPVRHKPLALGQLGNSETKSHLWPWMTWSGYRNEETDKLSFTCASFCRQIICEWRVINRELIKSLTQFISLCLRNIPSSFFFFLVTFMSLPPNPHLFSFFPLSPIRSVLGEGRG